MEQLKELMDRIHKLQEKINLVIEKNDFEEYEKLLELSRELDTLINNYVAIKRKLK